MFLSFFVLSILLSLILLINGARSFRSAVYLGVFFLLISFYGLLHYTALYTKSVALVSFFVVGIYYTGFLLFLIGPMLYWYVRSILTDNYHLKKNDLLHLLPMLVYLVAAIPEIMKPHPDRMQIAAKIVADSDYLKTYSATVLSDIFSVSAVYLSRTVLILGYTIASLRLLIRYENQKRKARVPAKQHFMIRWLWVLLVFVFVLISSQTISLIKVFSTEHSYVFYTLNSLMVLSGAALAGLLLSPFFFPNILYGMPRVPDSVGHQKSRLKKTKNNNSNFEAEYTRTIEKRIEAVMKESRPFLEPEFNMTHLSVMVQVPEHHLAWYFREERKQHFIDYRNEWRIQHAKSLIEQGLAEDLTLEAIGKMSGFLSRNAFRTVFEKIEGVPPSAFASRSKN